MENDDLRIMDFLRREIDDLDGQKPTIEKAFAAYGAAVREALLRYGERIYALEMRMDQLEGPQHGSQSD